MTSKKERRRGMKYKGYVGRPSMPGDYAVKNLNEIEADTV